MNLEQIMNFLPQNMRSNAKQALQKALQTIDPTSIKTRDDAIKVLNNLMSNGLPPAVLSKVNSYINNPIATPILGALGVNKQDFKNGLQSITQPDIPSAQQNSSLLSGIDQL